MLRRASFAVPVIHRDVPYSEESREKRYEPYNETAHFDPARVPPQKTCLLPPRFGRGHALRSSSAPAGLLPLLFQGRFHLCAVYVSHLKSVNC